MSAYRLVRGRLSDAMPLIRAYHYTRRRTADPMFVLLWLNDQFEVKAAAVFTSPINRYFGRGAVELSRLVRTPDMNVPLTKFVAECLRWLRKNTDLSNCLSYADQGVGHHGGIYQAANFIHVAEGKGNTMWRNDETGEIVSGRSFDQRTEASKRGFSRVRSGKKYLYVYPLSEQRSMLLSRFGWSPLPYPKPTPGRVSFEAVPEMQLAEPSSMQLEIFQAKSDASRFILRGNDADVEFAGIEKSESDSQKGGYESRCVILRGSRFVRC